MRTFGFEVRKIKSIKRINENTIWITIESNIDAIPGQFVMVWLPKIGEKPFSIAKLNPLGLLVVNVGAFSHALHQLNAGDFLWIKGPLGRGFEIEGKRLLLVGGGYGLAPLLPLAKQAKRYGKDVDVCLGAKNDNNLLLIDAFEDLGCHVEVATEDGTQGTKGYVTALVEKRTSEIKYDNLFACGPTGFLSALANICKKKKINYQLSWEAMIRCGMGLCGSCEVSKAFDEELPGGWLACFDGPVFIKTWDE